MNKFTTLFISALLLFFTNCKKETIPENSIIAGYHDSSMFYKIEDPLHIANFQWDSLQVTQHSSDTLLLKEGTSVHTLIFSIYRVNLDSLAKLPSNTVYNQYTHFSVKSNSSDPVKIKYVTKEYYAGLGTVASFNFVDPIQKNASINDSNMTNISNRDLNFFEMPPLGAGSDLYNYDNGPWYNIHAIRYIGILINNKLGWIELDANNNYQARILAYAIQK